MTADDVKARLAQAIAELGVRDEVAVGDVTSAPPPDQGGPRWTGVVRILARADVPVTIEVAGGLDEPGLGQELRAELRRALRMCPLCQRIGHVEKLRNALGQQEACLVRCPGCGEFEIDQALIRELRTAWERADRGVLDRLPAVADATRRGAAPRLTRDNWKS